jgi:hypothetical protein
MDVELSSAVGQDCADEIGVALVVEIISTEEFVYFPIHSVIRYQSRPQLNPGFRHLP